MAFHNVPPNGFPDLPDVEELEAVEKDVKTLKTTTSEHGAAITALGTSKAAKADIAPTFSAESNYAVGDLVYYEGTLYECTTEHEAAAWDAENFTAASIDDELSSLKSGLTNVSGKIPIRGSFTVHCSVGNNVFSRNTMDLVAGYIPQSPFNNCIMMIVNHGSNNATNDTIQVDGSEAIIINAQIEQNITVTWLDISNIPIANN